MKRGTILWIVLLLLTGCTPNPANRHDEQVIIALIDTGVSTTAIVNEHLLQGWNYVKDSDDTQDRINHGTAVASAIVGCESAGITGKSPKAYIVPLVVTDRGGEHQKSVTPEILAQIIRESIDIYHADIINISLGIKADYSEVKNAIEYAEKQGVLVICAVGNAGYSDEKYYPASYETVVAVGSHDKNGEVSDFSQRNGTVNILGPGEDIWLASRNGKKTEPEEPPMQRDTFPQKPQI